MGILAVCGNIISTLTAHFSGYKYDDIKNGLYGFNAGKLVVRQFAGDPCGQGNPVSVGVVEHPVMVREAKTQ